MNATPLIFLDMDDVLAISREFSSYQVREAFKLNDLDWPELWAGVVDEEARKHLAALHAEFAPHYVVSSSWGSFLSEEQFRELCQRTGLQFVAENLTAPWTTTHQPGAPRVENIWKWLQAHAPQPRPPVLVLDDTESGWSLSESPLDHAGQVVLCEPWVGLVQDRYQLARASLVRQLSA
jgi:hypothetical protein